MAEESKSTEYRTVGSVYLCNDPDENGQHRWDGWEYGIVKSNVPGVDHSYITRTCAACMLVERLELGFIQAYVPPAAETPESTKSGNVVTFSRKA